MKPPLNTTDPSDWHLPPEGSNGHCLLCGAATRSNVQNPVVKTNTKDKAKHRMTGQTCEYMLKSNTGWIITTWKPTPPKPPKPPKPVKLPKPTKEPPLMLKGPRFRTLVRPKKRPTVKPRPLELCRAYGYTRYSHEETRETSNDPKYQLKEIERFYARQSPRPQWGRFFHDECSGWSYDLEDRPAGADLLNTLEAGDWLIVFHPYRLGRQMDDVMHNIRFFRRTGVALKIVTIPDITDFNSPIGDIMLAGMSLGAQLQSQSISEYTKAAMKHHREMGRCNVTKIIQVPFGCRAEIRGTTRRGGPAYYAVPDDSVCEQYAHMLDLRNRGYSYEVIADVANKCGCERAPGRPWNASEAKKAVKWYAEKIGLAKVRSRDGAPTRGALETWTSSASWISPESRPAPPPSLESPAAAPDGP